jgi:hypothetical protein
MENFVPTFIFLVGIVLGLSLGSMGIDRVIEGQKQKEQQ